MERGVTGYTSMDNTMEEIITAARLELIVESVVDRALRNKPEEVQRSPERSSDRDRDRDRDRERDRHKKRDRDREPDQDREMERDRQRDQLFLRNHLPRDLHGRLCPPDSGDVDRNGQLRLDIHRLERRRLFRDRHVLGAD